MKINLLRQVDYDELVRNKKRHYSRYSTLYVYCGWIKKKGKHLIRFDNFKTAYPLRSSKNCNVLIIMALIKNCNCLYIKLSAQFA